MVAKLIAHILFCEAYTQLHRRTSRKIHAPSTCKARENHDQIFQFPAASDMKTRDEPNTQTCAVSLRSFLVQGNEILQIFLSPGEIPHSLVDRKTWNPADYCRGHAIFGRLPARRPPHRRARWRPVGGKIHAKGSMHIYLRRRRSRRALPPAARSARVVGSGVLSGVTGGGSTGGGSTGGLVG